MLGHSIVSLYFMEPDSSIPNSQELSTCSYPEPDQCRLSKPQGLVLPKGLDKFKNYLIVNRTRELPVCSIVS
jgi:hypothetical protein